MAFSLRNKKNDFESAMTKSNRCAASSEYRCVACRFPGSAITEPRVAEAASCSVGAGMVEAKEEADGIGTP
jgi:hypothetical protein